MGVNKMTGPNSRRSLGDGAKARFDQVIELRLEPGAKCRIVLRSGSRNEVWLSLMCYSCPFNVSRKAAVL